MSNYTCRRRPYSKNARVLRRIARIILARRERPTIVIKNGQIKIIPFKRISLRDYVKSPA